MRSRPPTPPSARPRHGWRPSRCFRSANGLDVVDRRGADHGKLRRPSAADRAAEDRHRLGPVAARRRHPRTRGDARRPRRESRRCAAGHRRRPPRARGTDGGLPGASDLRTGWMWLTVAALIMGNFVALPPQIELRRIGTGWDQWQRDAGTRGLAAMRVALDASLADAQQATDAALRAPAARMAAFAVLRDYDPLDYERGIVLFSGDTAFAWGGTVRVRVDDAAPGIQIVRTPVYTALRVTRV